MKYCINLNENRNFKYLDEVDEILINWTKIDKTLSQFLEQHSHQTVILQVAIVWTEQMFDYFDAIVKKYKNIKFCIPFEDAKLMVEHNYPFYFIESAWTLEEFYTFLSYPITDITLMGDMGFKLNKLSSYAHDKGVKIRVKPHMCNGSALTEAIPDILHFFIRPEDIESYEEYVDICDLYALDNKANFFYKVYAKQKKWFGNLKELILFMEDDIDSRSLIPAFGRYRVKCGHKCMYGRCGICIAAENLGKTLQDGKMIFNKNIDDKIDFTQK